MSLYFIDTSALTKRYIPERGTSWLIREIEGQTIFVSELTSVEMISVLARNWREKRLSQSHYEKLESELDYHLKTEYLIVELQREIFTDSRALLKKHPLRTLDALQLACALYVVNTLNLQPVFVCSDQRLLQAAAAEGLSVENPEDHT